MNNYYPITDDKADLDFLIKHWKANNIFPNLSEDDVDFFIMWHSIKGYINPFILRGDEKVFVLLTFLKNNDQITQHNGDDGNIIILLVVIGTIHSLHSLYN